MQPVQNKLTDKSSPFADNNVLLSQSNKMLTKGVYNIAAINFQHEKTAAIYFKHSSLFLMIWSLVFVSCEKTKIQFGQAYVDNSYSNIILVDTITTELSTVYSDSVPTSASGSILAGNYNDNFFGKVTAKSFSNLHHHHLLTWQTLQFLIHWF